jgi:hypothetical protein
MKLRKITIVTVSLSAFYLILSSNASGPGGNRTGSPGSSGNCSGCHSNAQVSGSVDILVKDLNGNVVTSYIPNTKYNITVNSSGNSSKYGFQFTAMNSNNQKVGTYGSAPSKTSVYNSGQAQIWGHTSPATTSQSAIWTIEWTSPAAGSGDITMYTASVISNGNNSESGDFVATKNMKLTESPTNNTVKISMNDFHVYFDQNNSVITANQELKRVLVWDYSGKLVKSSEEKKSNCSLNDLKPGIYIVNALSLTSQNKTTLKIVVD